MNIQAMMREAQKLQKEMMKEKDAIDATEYEAESSFVKVKINGKKELIELKLSPDAVDPDDVEMLEDMIISAVNEALRKADEAAASSLKGITGGMSIPGLF